MDITFRPSVEQKRAKAAFWARVESQAALGEEHVSLARAMQVLGDARLERWWKTDGFAEWFGNKHETAQRLEYLVDLGISAMETLLLSTDPKMASAQVNAFKALLEARGKMLGKNQQVRFLDAALEKMSERELDKLIGKVEEKPSVDD